MARGDRRREEDFGAPVPDVIPETVPTPPQVLPPTEEEVLVGVALSKSNPLHVAFIHEERRLNGTRKLPVSEWKRLYNEFLTKPR